MKVLHKKQEAAPVSLIPKQVYDLILQNNSIKYVQIFDRSVKVIGDITGNVKCREGHQNYIEFYKEGCFISIDILGSANLILTDGTLLTGHNSHEFTRFQIQFSKTIDLK
jgi:hypothetical protein